jgi:hypothetical protein
MDPQLPDDLETWLDGLPDEPIDEAIIERIVNKIRTNQRRVALGGLSDDAFALVVEMYANGELDLDAILAHVRKETQ